MKEFKEDHEKLEEDIVKLINEFEEKYKCYIYEINLIHDGGRHSDGKMDIKTVTAMTRFSF